MAKKAFYLKYEDIPEADRADYTHQNGKWVLQIDGVHPLMEKNTELKNEKTKLETEHSQVLQSKDSEIQRLTTELQTAKSQPALTAGHVAVPAADALLITEIKALGDIGEVKTKVQEHASLKAESETNAKRARLTEIAERNGLNAEAFVNLALRENVLDSIDQREIDDGKGNKVKHDFVKSKDESGAEKAVAITDFVKENSTFKPFVSSLFAGEDADKKKVKIPQTKIGDPPQEKSGAAAYINRYYKRPEEKKE